ncbi:hypothetical protein [Rhizocola hellebori]|nr:hypothetical protein [Rhizocola hellebori]
MAVELVLWHEPARISHADALVKARTLRELSPHPAIAAFADELMAQLPDVDRKWDKKSYLKLSIKSSAARSAVPRVRYLAAKHRLVCFDLDTEAVVNPPLLRRNDGYELATDKGFPIEDPTAEHLARAAQSLSDDNWFMVLEGHDDNFVQCGYGARAAVPEGHYMLEVRDEKHLQAEVASLDEVIAAFQAEAAGDRSWRDSFTWQPVVNLS